MAYILATILLASAYLIEDIQCDCQDVNKIACGVFLKADAKMCEKKCLADLCQDTCGLCPLKCYHCDSVDDPADCTTSVACQSIAELCIATQRFTTHLKPVFSSGCVNSAVCKTLFGPITKRAYSLHGGCCSSDLCNDHDPDNFTMLVNSTSSDEEFIDQRFVQESVSEDLPADTCAAYDMNNVACGILYNADHKVCKNDCIARAICPETCKTCARCKTCKNVDDPANCNNITLCKSSQSCFTKEQLRPDFTLGYDLECMDDFICYAYFGGIKSVPKRQVGGNIRLSGQCCKANLCNQNGIIQAATTVSSGK